MKLTGKCKEDFEKWYIENYPLKGLDNEYIRQSHIDWFNSNILFQSMKYGVYVDFFDSVGVKVDVFTESKYPDLYFDFRITEVKKSSFWGTATIGEFKTRQEARTKAIEKANEIYNINNGEK